MIDNTQLTTIVVTAVVSVIAKEVLIWLVALVKKTATTATIRAKLRTVFNKINFFIFGDLLSVATWVYWLVHVGWSDNPTTGKDVLIILGCLFGIVSMIGMLLIHVAQAVTMNSPSKRQPALPLE